MKTVTLEVATLQEVKRRAQAAFTGRKQGARISFATPELLFQAHDGEALGIVADNDRGRAARDQRGGAAR